MVNPSRFKLGSEFWKPKSKKAKCKNPYENRYAENADGVKFGTLLRTWKGSVVKLIYAEFLLFLFAYFLLSIIYRHILVAYDLKKQRQYFELLCIYVRRFQSVLPIAFITGFYVSTVVNRWWSTFMTLPFPDKLALKLTTVVAGNSSFKRNLRLTIMRYVNLSTLLVYRLIARQVRDRFPDEKSLVDAKMLLPHEAERLSKVDRTTPHEASWLPILWAMKLLQKANSSKKPVEQLNIPPPVFSNLISSFSYITDKNRTLLNYGWVEMPLAYTQVVTTAVHMYFVASLFGRQYLLPHKGNEEPFLETHIEFSTTDPFKYHTPDFVIPIFTLLEFVCYIGWIKVAATLLNPFGDDDLDFSINYLIDRNLQVSYQIVDEADNDLEMAADPFLEAGITVPDELPYEPEHLVETEETVRKRSVCKDDKADIEIENNKVTIPMNGIDNPTFENDKK